MLYIQDSNINYIHVETPVMVNSSNNEYKQFRYQEA